MILTIFVPTDQVLEQQVRKIKIQTPHGNLTLLPRHIDLVTVLLPGILSYETEDGTERFVAVDHGYMVKQGHKVRVSTINALHGPQLGDLERAVRIEFRELDEEERQARRALAEIEAHFVRRYLEIGATET